MSRVYITNEHPEWLRPLGKALDELGVPWSEWFVDEGSIDLSTEPPPGVYFNRISASSHTRGHASSVTHTRELLAWLESHGRRVLNGTRAIDLEMSKARQMSALKAAGIRVPRTVAVIGGPGAVVHAARRERYPLIVKPNRGGKGLGVRLVRSHEELEAYACSEEFEMSPDGVTLLQAYIRAPEPYITRCEYVGGQFVYAIRSSTTDGFELCPADACGPCAIGPRFALREGFSDPLLLRYSMFLRSTGLDVCGVEFIEGPDGEKYTYDLNGTTNYNSDVEAVAPTSATQALARLLQSELGRARENVAFSAGIAG